MRTLTTFRGDCNLNADSQLSNLDTRILAARDAAEAVASDADKAKQTDRIAKARRTSITLEESVAHAVDDSDDHD